MANKDKYLFKQNIYDLRINTRIAKKAFLFILIGITITYGIGVIVINSLIDLSLVDLYWLYVFKFVGFIILFELNRRRIHDSDVSGKWIYLWSSICFLIYLLYFIIEGNILSFEKILVAEVLIFFGSSLILYFLPTYVLFNLYGHSSYQYIDNHRCIGYLKRRKSIANQKGIFEYMKSVYYSAVFSLSERATLAELLSGISLMGIVIGLNIYILSFSLFLAKYFDLGLLRTIGWGLFYLLYLYILVALISLFIRRLHDSLYSGFWILFLLIPYFNIFILYRLFIKESWDISNIVIHASNPNTEKT